MFRTGAPEGTGDFVSFNLSVDLESGTGAGGLGDAHGRALDARVRSAAPPARLRRLKRGARCIALTRVGIGLVPISYSAPVPFKLAFTPKNQ